MSGEGCGEPMRFAPKEGARGGTMGSLAQETGGSLRSQEEGDTWGKHGFPHDRETKPSGDHSTAAKWTVNGMPIAIASLPDAAKASELTAAMNASMSSHSNSA